MELDDNLKRLMKDLGNAINDSLAESDSIAQAIENIKSSGYDIFLVLEATIGFNKRTGEQDEEDAASAEPGEGRMTRSESLELTNQDAKFLKSLRISIDEDRRPQK